VLSKKYTNPSSDIISVLAGLHDADAVFADFVASLEVAIRNGRTGAFLYTNSYIMDVELIPLCSGSAAKGREDSIVHGVRSLPNRLDILFHTQRPLSRYNEGGVSSPFCHLDTANLAISIRLILIPTKESCRHSSS
jgi:hypothetical protein